MTTRNLGDAEVTLLAAFGNGASARTVAATLGLSKSALGRSIVALEAAVGADIFLRRGRSLVPTSFGAKLIEHARAAEVARSELHAVASEAGLVGPRLTIAASPLFGELVLPAVLADLAARRPASRFEVRLGHGYAELFDERVDVAIRRGPLADSTSLNAKRLGSLAMICVAAPTFAVPEGEDVDADAVAALPWIRVGSTLAPFALPLGGRKAIEARLQPRICVDSQRAAMALAEASAGVARVNAFLARDAIAAGRLREVLPSTRKAEAAFAVYPRRSRPSRLLADFLTTLAAVSKRLDIWDRE